jgi:cytochrome P450
MQSTLRAAGLTVPSPKGLEHLLVMNQAATYINAAVMDLHQKYGEIFAFGFGPIRFHWLVGHDALKFVLLDNPDAFSMKRAYGFLEVIGGSTALISSDEPEHLHRRRIVQPAFHGTRIQRWNEQFQVTIEAFYNQRENQTFDFYALTRSHMLGLIVMLLLGKETLARYPNLLKDVETLMHFANLPFLAQQFKIALPGLPWYTFIQARKRVNKILYHEIQTRKPSANDDSLLAMLLETKDESGKRLTDKEIRDQCVSLVSAGFDTTAATLTWGVYLLLTHPRVLESLRSEVIGVMGGGWRVMAKPFSPSPITHHPSPLLDAVINETLRLYPAAPAGLRMATRDLEYKGFHIPKGSLLAYSIYATHRQESIFSDALQFKPERWLEGKKLDTFDYLPFGYGGRYCIGARLATTLVKLHLTHLLCNYEIKADWQTPIEETGNTVQPKGGLPVLLLER